MSNAWSDQEERLYQDFANDQRLAELRDEVVSQSRADRVGQVLCTVAFMFLIGGALYGILLTFKAVLVNLGVHFAR